MKWGIIVTSNALISAPSIPTSTPTATPTPTPTGNDAGTGADAEFKQLCFKIDEVDISVAVVVNIAFVLVGGSVPVSTSRSPAAVPFAVDGTFPSIVAVILLMSARLSWFTFLKSVAVIFGQET